jgi:AcrR family transcriptional regulator
LSCIRAPISTARQSDHAQKNAQGLVIYRQSIKELKRKAILKAAHEAFLAEGFNRAAVHVIAHRADSSTATLYKYFKSKERLFEEVM